MRILFFPDNDFLAYLTEQFNSAKAEDLEAMYNDAKLTCNEIAEQYNKKELRDFVIEGKKFAEDLSTYIISDYIDLKGFNYKVRVQSYNIMLKKIEDNNIKSNGNELTIDNPDRYDILTDFVNNAYFVAYYLTVTMFRLGNPK